MTSEELFFLPEDAKKSSQKKKSSPVLAKNLPVARVTLDIKVTHLDRLFDYAVPATLDEVATIGVRVRVRFGGKLVDGFIIERISASEYNNLVVIHKVYSPLCLLTSPMWQLSQQVSQRYAATTREILRYIIPPRRAQVEKEILTEKNIPTQLSEKFPSPLVLAELLHGQESIDLLKKGKKIKCALSCIRSYGKHSWTRYLFELLYSVASRDKGVLIVLPDQKDIEQLCQEITSLAPDLQYVILSASQDSVTRYRNYCLVVQGICKIVIGTRSSIFAPIHDLELIMCWDDLDPSHQEEQAPYFHTRDIALLRSEDSKCSLIFAGFSRSIEIQRLIELQWLQEIKYNRHTLRNLTPLMQSLADETVLERDPLALHKRLPDAAFKTITAGLHHGPILMGVPVGGVFPALSCQQCRTLALCTQCHGPLYVIDDTVSCRWCAHIQKPWTCSTCEGIHLRSRIIGSERTAYEMGRSFPGYKVISSSKHNRIQEVSQQPQIVVSTPGAEPLAPLGYSATIIVDADLSLSRSSLHATESALHHWFRAASLTKPGREGGKVLLLSQNQKISNIFFRWAPENYAHDELKARKELLLPPAVRIAAIEGSRFAIEQVVDAIAPYKPLEILGPYPLTVLGLKQTLLQEEKYRAIIKFTYAQGSEITQALYAERMKIPQKKLPLSIKIDVNRLL